jgi:excisionase family DNA binding protein
MDARISQVERRRLPDNGRRNAMSIDQFCQRYAVGRTTVYAEIKQGRLRGLKVGRRTIITENDAEDWLHRLPAIETGSAS